MTCFEISQTSQALEKRYAHEQRLAKLQADLESSRAVLSVEVRGERLVELFKLHLALEDALIAELLRERGEMHRGGPGVKAVTT